MAKPKHTPGPWEFHHRHWKFPIMGPNQEIIVERIGKNEANAQLIAAAPEMLEALQKVKRTFQNKEDIGLKLEGDFVGRIMFGEMVSAVEQAITKATGGTSDE